MIRPPRCLLALAALLALNPAASAQLAAPSFPLKPMRMIVAFPPGGGTDIVARIIAAKLGEEFRQQVIVDNRAGADGIIGTDIAAKATPDGHVMFVGTAGNLAINQSLYSKVPFDIARDFAAVTQLVSVDMLLTVHPALSAKTVGELIALAKASPGTLNYASTGVGGIPHLTTELLNHMAGIRLNHVPYKGGGPAMVELIAGHVQVFVQSVVQGAAPVREGRVRALAVLGPKRSMLLPDVPTMGESIAGYAATNWYGLVVPAKTPAAIQDRIYLAVAKIMRNPETDKRITAQGAIPVISSPTEFSAFMKAETAKWATVIKSANIRAE